MTVALGKDGLPESNFKKYWFAGSLITYGLLKILVDNNRIKSLKYVNLNEFEEEYLLRGEVFCIFYHLVFVNILNYI